jgi:hypothetical protein
LGPVRAVGRSGVVLAVVAVALSWVMAAAGGAAGIPRTDDWAFGRVAFGWARTGHLRLVGWGQMSLVGLVAWAQPWIRVFGAQQWVLDLAGGVLVVAGLVAAHQLARAVLDDASATVAVLCVMVCPGFLRDATSFMTDGPALALSTLCLLAGVRVNSSSGRRRTGWLVATLVIGFCAFTVRELAIAAPAAVLAAAFFARRDDRKNIVVGGACLAIACIAFLMWRHGLPGQQPYWGVPPLFVVVELVVNGVFSLALGIAPALAITAPRWWHPRARTARRIGMVFGGLLALVPVAYAQWSWDGRYKWLLGDYLDPRGMNADKLLSGTRQILLPAPVYFVLVVGAVTATVITCGLIAEHLALRHAGRVAPGPPAIRMLVAHVLLGAGVIAIAAARNAAVFDRYLWPIVLSSAILVLHHSRQADYIPSHRGPRAARGIMVVVVVGFVTAIAVVLTANSDAFDGTRWRLANRAVAAGYGPGTIDAGFEWIGAHSDAKAQFSRAASAPDRYRTSWANMFSTPTICVVESSSPLPDPRLTLVDTTRWHTLLIVGSARMYTYVTGEPDCPKP